VRLEDGRIVASGRACSGIEASLPLDARWTLEVAGELMLDRGHTGHCSGGPGFFFWAGSEPRRDPAETEAEFARLRVEGVAAANVSVRRRLALRSDTQTVLVHESDVSRSGGGEVVQWPPIVGPAGVLLRHAIVADDGQRHNA
jgi:hypothetical protein